MAHTYVILDDSGNRLNAHLSIEGNDVILHSRGGAKQSGTNADYAAGLNLILQRLYAAGTPILGAWVDSVMTQALPLSQRAILFDHEGTEAPAKVLKYLSTRMKSVRAEHASPPKGGNSTRRVRIGTGFIGTKDALAALIKSEALEGDTKGRDRLAAEVLASATPDFVWEAVQQFSAGSVNHSFSSSKEFDLISDDGQRLPPKAVFGVALSLALGGAPIKPLHFSGGEGSTCFRLLRAAGYRIVPKDAPVEPNATDDEPDGDAVWEEGKERIDAHRKRERGHGLAKAKKAQFVKQHGALRCERCKLDPVKHYNSAHAESCIEVHHALVHVSEMTEGHKTKLGDLQCLCANCHRLVHRLIRKGEHP